MKKHGKIIKLILTAIAITSLFCFFAVAACGSVGDDGGGKHTHEWGEWQINAEEHWRECTAEDAEQRENHVFVNGECSVCGYKRGQHFHEWGEWQKNAEEHWRVCTANDAEQRENHVFVNGECSVCGYAENQIPGLVFSDDGTGRGYSVSSDKTFDGVSVNIPRLYSGKPVTTVAMGAFQNNKNLYSVVLPDTVKTISDSAFSGCASLCDIDIPSSVEDIGGSAFRDCTNLTSVKLRVGLKNINNNAFRKSGLTSVNIPEGVICIGKSAFYDCKTLSNITFPSTLTSVSGDCVFGTAYYNNSSHYSNNVLYVGEYCLCINKALGSVPSDISVRPGTTLLADRVFAVSSIKSVTLPTGLKYIGDLAFNLANISEINIPQSVEKIGVKVFSGCKNLTSITGGGAYLTVKDNCIIEKSSRKLVAVCKNSTIPSDGTVKSIGSGVFSNNGITSIVLPESVESVEDGAFSFEPFGGVETIYYLGNAEKFSRISVGDDNANFKDASVYYYSAAEPKKTLDGSAYDGKYWYYDGSLPKKWVLVN